MSNQNNFDLYVRQTQRQFARLESLMIQLLEQAIPIKDVLTLTATNLEQAMQIINPIGDKLNKMAISVDDLVTKVTAQGTVIGGAVTLLQNLSQMVKDAGTDPVKLQAISDALDSQDKQLADAVVANTPASTTPPIDNGGGNSSPVDTTTTPTVDPNAPVTV